ncbi:phage minor head protein [Blastochloris tepida]|uniref:Phage head morphogenesis domain-containing protein n=1 Tax=Blastochloris tepida TaxID=2233851 RepID=A0A348FYI5_9HYPH|nr:phage minor head protein [Blastochloris tepida]BBF92368.1 hypothetical protein BLTE_10530 [Blastochloris tepida]
MAQESDGDNPFRRPPEEVRRFFERRRIRPTYHWAEITPPEYAHAWSVAKTAGFDVLEDIFKAVRKAIDERQDFDQFRRELEPILVRKGWWGQKTVLDPLTGRPSLVQLGSPRRLRLIYWANIRAARAAGEWERTWRTREVLPYLLYEMSTARDKRPEHLSWVGTILPVEDPWWQTHYPPNGWGCQCGTRQISAWEAEQKGYDPTRRPPHEGETKVWTNRRTGEARAVPRGIDPGWDGNPGLERGKEAGRLLSGALDAMPEERRRNAVADLIGSPLFRWIREALLGYDYRRQTEAAMRQLGSVATPVAVLPERLAQQLGVQTRTVLFSVADADKQARRRLTRLGGQALTQADYEAVQAALEGTDLIVRDGVELEVHVERGGKPWVAVLHRTGDGREVYLKSWRRARPEQVDAARRTAQARENGTDGDGGE